MLDYWRLLKPGGRLVGIGGGMRQFRSALFLGPVLNRLGDRRLRLLLHMANREDLLAVAARAGAVGLKSVIDRAFPLARIAEALEHWQSGRPAGKIVITMGAA